MIGRIAIITNIVRYISPENAGVSPFHHPTSCTPEGGSEVLMKVALVLQTQMFRISFFYLGFLSQITFTNHRTAGKGEGISLTPHYHFHPLHRHLDIGLAITAESSLLHIEVNREPLVSQRISLTTKLYNPRTLTINLHALRISSK